MEILSLAALAAVIALSCFTKINPGLLSLGLAWILGTWGARMRMEAIIAGFPTYLFIILVGVTYLFSMAKHNGTLEKLTRAALFIFKDKPKHLPLLFFALALILSTIGAGNIATVALLAPIAMSVAWETGIGGFFMTIILICGANAGTFSPFSLTGIIANGLTQRSGLTLDPWMQIYWPNLAAQSLLALMCYLFFFKRLKDHRKHAPPPEATAATHDLSWSFSQKITFAAILLLLAGTVIFKFDIGLLALTLGSLLALFNITESKEAVKLIPWNTILMVCGVNTLIGILEQVGGLDLLTDLLAKVSTPQNVTAVTALTTGVISAFSSSSGVVLPTFIPLVPDLVAKIGGGNPVAIVSSINVGAHLVDISPLSSLGALCLASALHEDKDKLFRNLLVFGLFMSAAGAIICYLLFK